MSESSGGGGAVLRSLPAPGETATDAVDEDFTGITEPTRRGGGSRFISDVIVQLGFLDEERVQTAVDEAKSSGRTPEQVLMEASAISSEQLARAVAERFSLRHVDLQVYKADLGATNLISPQIARRFNAVPIGFEDDGGLMVAMADPSNVLALDDLKLMTGHELRPVVASPEDITGLIGRMSRLDEAVAEAVEEEYEDERASITEIRETAEDAPVIKLVNSII